MMANYPETRVVHCSEPHDVYIGRPSMWGNPFKEDDGGTRTKIIRQYKEWLMYDPEAAELRLNLHQLEGKTLGCWCKPKACHGDVIVELLNNGVLDYLQ
jgi:hypothetical protein